MFRVSTRMTRNVFIMIVLFLSIYTIFIISFNEVNFFSQVLSLLFLKFTPPKIVKQLGLGLKWDWGLGLGTGIGDWDW